MTKTSPYHLRPGFPEDQRDVVARLFWGAFKGKLAPVMRPEQRALAFLRDVADPDHAISAISPAGEVLGIAGFKTANGAFIGGGFSDLAAAYGQFGALWRGAALSLLERPVQQGSLLMDGIFVAGTARGTGIGTRLLCALRDVAQDRGLSYIRLDVIDNNPRARSLYERNGFVAQKTVGIGPLRHIFGFRSATEMVAKV